MKILRTLAAVLALAPFAAYAQATATLTGSVLDPSRAPISGAVLRFSPESGPTLESVSDARGEFAVVLPGGTYTVSALKEGFLTASKSVALAGGVTESREFVLTLAAVRNTVTVTDSAPYQVSALSSATKTLTPLRDVPQAITVVSQELIQDQMMLSIGDVVRYVPGITATQGENNRDQLTIRGNATSADFFLNGVRDDVQYFRDLYNLDRVEALKGPNAMIFGRGGGGGVVNRVTKEAGSTPLHQFTVMGGSFGGKRATLDLNQPLNGKIALRLNTMFEDSGSFRDHVDLRRYGISPTLTLRPASSTKITMGYENARDDRTADRGVPSYQNRPVNAANTFFGDPEQSFAGSRVNLGWVALEQQVGRVTVRNRLMIGDYNRGYQNFVPGAVTADGSQVSLSSYNNATHRRNLFDQTDIVFSARTGRVRHQFLAGLELGRQPTDNFRNTGYFNQTNATSVLAPMSAPTIRAAVNYRQSATDADNHIDSGVAATYVQDQVDLTSRVQVVAGLRFDHFDLRYRNNRTGEKLQRIDNIFSPRAGLVFKATGQLSLYGSYSETHLPGSGDQFSSLTSVTQQLKPEQVRNYEGGAKWDVNTSLSLTAAVYRMDRTNTRSTDPNDPTRIVQTGSQRTNGFEIGANGQVTARWNIAGGYAWQDAFVTSATASAKARAQVAQVPHHTFSLWNNYRVLPRLSAGLGLLARTSMFAAIDNTVRLPGYARADAAVFYSLTERIRLQANVENLLNHRYFLNADSNANISPGSTRALRIGLVTRF